MTTTIDAVAFNVRVPRIPKDEVMARWARGPRWDREMTNEAEFLAFYLEPVAAFGLVLRHQEHPGMTAWLASGDELPPDRMVMMDLIRSSTQSEGVLLSVIAQVITDGTDEAPCDPEGWFGNDRPLLFEWPDGTYTVRDGNHRCIGGQLRGDTHIDAYVIPYGYTPSTPLPSTSMNGA